MKFAFSAGFYCCIFLGVASLAFYGCGSTPPALVPAGGKITVGGVLLKKGTVVFTPEQSSANRERSIGTITEDGKYTLNTNGSPGAPKGTYKVTVFVGKVGPIRDDAPFQRKYSSLEETPLSVEITNPPASEAIDFDLMKK